MEMFLNWEIITSDTQYLSFSDFGALKMYRQQELSKPCRRNWETKNPFATDLTMV